MSNKAVGIGCLGFLLLIVGLFILGLLVGNRDTQPSNKTPDNDSIAIVRTPGKSDVIKAAQLAHTYQRNEISADKLYNGTTLVITGEVISIGKTLGVPYVVLEGRGKGVLEESDYDVQVIFNRSETDKISKLIIGDTIKVKATCSGLTLGNVILNNAELR